MILDIFLNRKEYIEKIQPSFVAEKKLDVVSFLGRVVVPKENTGVFSDEIYFKQAIKNLLIDENVYELFEKIKFDNQSNNDFLHDKVKTIYEVKLNILKP